MPTYAYVPEPPPLTPEELAALEAEQQAMQAEAIPPPDAQPAGYRPADAYATQAAVPPPAAAPDPVASEVYGGPVPEPVSAAYGNPDIVTTTYPSSGAPVADIRSVSSGYSTQANLPPRDTGLYAYPQASAVPEPATSSNPLDIFRPLVQSAQQTVSNVANTSPSRNRAAVGRLWGNVAGTDPRANREAAVGAGQDLARRFTESDTEANRRGAVRAINEWGPLGLSARAIHGVAENALPFLFGLSEQESTAGLVGEPYGPFDNPERDHRAPSFRVRQDRFGGWLQDTLPDVDIDAGLSGLGGLTADALGAAAGVRSDRSGEDVLAHEKQYYPVFGAGLWDAITKDNTDVLSTLGQMQNFGSGTPVNPKRSDPFALSPFPSVPDPPSQSRPYYPEERFPLPEGTLPAPSRT